MHFGADKRAVEVINAPVAKAGVHLKICLLEEGVSTVFRRN